MAMDILSVNVQVDEAYTWLVDVEDLVAVVRATLAHQGIRHGSVTVAITDDAVVQALNRSHRDEDAPTDVLSFASHEMSPQQAGSVQLVIPAELAAEVDAYLGDLVIAYPYAARQAEEDGLSVQSELRLLSVHGTLHLLGFDHSTPAEEAAMWSVQEEILGPDGIPQAPSAGHG